MMERLERDVPFPVEMQGRWTDVEDSTSELIVGFYVEQSS